MSQFYHLNQLDIIAEDCTADTRAQLCPNAALNGLPLCAGAGCAWWNPDAQQCAILVLSYIDFAGYVMSKPVAPPVPHTGQLPVALAAAIAAHDSEVTAAQIIAKEPPVDSEPLGPFDVQPSQREPEPPRHQALTFDDVTTHDEALVADSAPSPFGRGQGEGPAGIDAKWINAQPVTRNPDHEPEQ